MWFQYLLIVIFRKVEHLTSWCTEHTKYILFSALEAFEHDGFLDLARLTSPSFKNSIGSVFMILISHFFAGRRRFLLISVVEINMNIVQYIYTRDQDYPKCRFRCPQNGLNKGVSEWNNRVTSSGPFKQFTIQQSESSARFGRVLRYNRLFSHDPVSSSLSIVSCSFATVRERLTVSRHLFLRDAIQIEEESWVETILVLFFDDTRITMSISTPQLPNLGIFFSTKKLGSRYMIA